MTTMTDSEALAVLDSIIEFRPEWVNSLEQIEQARAHIAEALRDREWRPIESAPKDGKEFQAWCVFENSGWWEPRAKFNGDGILVVWGPIDYDQDGWDFLCAPNRPTHWMPLPEPPK